MLGNYLTLEEVILDRNMKGRKAISMLNGILWDRTINKMNNNRKYDTLEKSTIMYSGEVWPMNENVEKILKSTEMDYWRRATEK